MSNFGQTTIAEYKPMEGDLVLRFSERVLKEPYTMFDGSRGTITKLIVQAEELENDGFGHYLPVEVHTFAEQWTELCATVPAEYCRRTMYTHLVGNILETRVAKRSD